MRIDHREETLEVIRGRLRTLLNLDLFGRNGMHKYNNQDHSMMTALLAAGNILGLGRFGTWKVDTEAEYNEGAAEDDATSGRAVPWSVDAT